MEYQDDYESRKIQAIHAQMTRTQEKSIKKKKKKS